MHYRDKEWLYHQYIELGKSYDTIAEEFNIGKTTVARYVKKFGIKPEENIHFRGKYKDREKVVVIACAHCGIDVKKKPASIRYANTERNGVKRGEMYGKFCSPSCASKWQHANTDIGKKVKEGYRRFLSTPEGKATHAAQSLKGWFAASDGRRTSIEVKMAEELERRGIEYVEQYNLGNKFALDFYLPEYNIALECDGSYWHSRPEAIRRDKRKNAYIAACGISLFRFWESEINTCVESCVDIVFLEINEAGS